MKHKQFEDLQIIRRNRKTKREEKNLKEDKFRAETFARAHIMMSINVAIAVDFCLLVFSRAFVHSLQFRTSSTETSRWKSERGAWRQQYG